MEINSRESDGIAASSRHRVNAFCALHVDPEKEGKRGENSKLTFFCLFIFFSTAAPRFRSRSRSPKRKRAPARSLGGAPRRCSDRCCCSCGGEERGLGDVERWRAPAGGEQEASASAGRFESPNSLSRGSFCTERVGNKANISGRRRRRSVGGSNEFTRAFRVFRWRRLQERRQRELRRRRQRQQQERGPASLFFLSFSPFPLPAGQS